MIFGYFWNFDLRNLRMNFAKNAPLDRKFKLAC